MTPQERIAVIEECLSVIRAPDENCNCGQCRASRANREAVATLKQAGWLGQERLFATDQANASFAPKADVCR
jgi:hypothetical protein